MDLLDKLSKFGEFENGKRMIANSDYCFDVISLDAVLRICKRLSDFNYTVRYHPNKNYKGERLGIK